MQNNKGWDFLTTFADINDNYIYQASKPWKENKIKTFKMPLKKVIACAVIVMIVGLGLTHQNEVKAAWEKMTSLIGQILGISEDTGEYIKQIQNKIAKNGVTVSLEEVAVDDENLWIAYSMTDENGNNDVSMSSIEVSVDGVKLELERQYSNYNNTDSKSKDYVARFSLKASSAKQNFEITIGNFNTNTQYGIKGITKNIDFSNEEKYKVASLDEVELGNAQIILQNKQNKCVKYDIEILKIENQTSPSPKTFKIKIVDEDLLRDTGGIVQGMSGTPIIQNGKIIGAVSHALENNPKVGYGVYIKWML